MAIRKTAAMPKKYYFERSERLVGLSEKLFGEAGASKKWMDRLHANPNVSPYGDFYARLAYVTGSVLHNYLNGIYRSPSISDREALRKVLRLQARSLALNKRFMGRVSSAATKAKERDERTMMRDYRAAILHLGSVISMLRTEPALKFAYSAYRLQHAMGKDNLRSAYRLLLETGKAARWKEANR